MRSLTILAGALTLMMMTGARAEGWCGYAAHEKSLIECGYSSATECESAIGKGGMCFVDPDYALNVKHALPAVVTPAVAAKRDAGQS
jgi:hypothetical protein